MPGGLHDFTTAEIKVINAKLAKKKKTRLQSTLQFGLNSSQLNRGMQELFIGFQRSSFRCGQCVVVTVRFVLVG